MRIMQLRRVATACLSGIAVLASHAYAAPPPANSVIGNQATVTYLDTTGTARTATSNLVQTTVQQVFSYTFTAANSVFVSPGGTVYFPHTISNTGNGADIYALAATQASGGGFSYSNVTIFADVNGDGLPDNSSPITTTGTLNAGQSFRYVVRAQVPASATTGQTSSLTVSATPTGGNSQPALTDTATISNNAVVNVTKAYSATTGGISPTLTVTLSFTNNGNVGATDLVLTDVIGSASTVAGVSYDTRDLRYVANSLKVNGIACAAPYTCVQPAALTGIVNVTIPTLAPGQSGTVSFDVTATDLTPGSEKTLNVASFVYDPDGTGPATATPAAPTNSVRYAVQTAGMTGVAIGDSSTSGAANTLTSSGNNANGTAAGSLADATVTNPATGADDGVLISNPIQGSALVFHLIVTNTGASSDAFNLTVGNGGTFPANTTFRFVNASGVPLTDTNGDGIPDTGLLAPNMAMPVYVSAKLPADAISNNAASQTVTATSTQNSATSDTTTININNILSRGGVDVSRNGVDGSGMFSGDSLAAATETIAADPGQSATFTLMVRNLGQTADSFDLSAWGSYTNNPVAADTMGAMPAGYTVQFKSRGDSACPALGAVVSNTGTMGANASCTFDVVVTIPRNTAAGTQSLYLRAISPVNGIDGTMESTFDVMRNAITINTVTAISLTPNSSAQIAPGSAAFLTHRLCNAGNVAITSAGLTLTSTHSNTEGWTNVVYVDSNGNGVLDTGEPVYAASNGALAAGECVSLINKVFSPTSAQHGALDSVTLSVSGLAGSASVTASATDAINVVSGALTALKEQQKLASCTSSPVPSSYTTEPIGGASPGDCLAYRITVTNTSAGPVSNLAITDTVPNYSTLHTTGCPIAGSSSAGTPSTSGSTATHGETGEVRATLGTLPATATMALQFCTRLSQ